MSTKTTEQLHQQIEQLIRAHLAAQKAATAAAVERAFASATVAPRAKAPHSDGKAWGRRRPPKEVAGIAERLYDAVRAHPGETMAVIAPEVGEPARALNRPMHHLKQAGRVKSVGQRHLTRYFPMTPRSA